MRLRILLLTCVCAALLGVAADAPDDWPRWRGPNDNGVARGDAPLEWSDTKNVAWRTPIAGRGMSTPVLWGDKVFLTTAVPTGKVAEPATAAPPPPPPGPPPGASGPGPGGPPPQGRGRGPGGGPGGGSGAGQEHRFLVLCLDRRTGKVLWEREATVATPHEGYHRQYGSFASNAPVTDGRMVYAFFGSRGLYAYDLNGKLAWKKDFPPMKMLLSFGEGVAPVLDGDSLYLKFDHQEGSYLLALDKRNGKELWRVDRDETSSWSAPLMVTHQGKKQLVVSASKKVRSYDPASGKVIWEVAGLGANVIPVPVAANGMVYAMSGFRNPNLLAIKLGREGDLTGADAIAWTNDRGNSYTPSPVLHDNKLYILTDNGTLTCLNATTGEAHYRQQRLPKTYNFKASPVAANGKLYLATEQGDVVVVKMGETFEVLATNTMPDQVFISSPVIAGGSIYLRSQDALYCIRDGGAKGSGGGR
jgi:outer membrane protein assembly factor BamB